MVNEMVSPSLLDKAERALLFAQEQVKKLVTEYPGYFPLYTREGRWYHEGQPWTRWGEGFLAGLLWIFAQRTGERWWRERAEEYCRLFEHRKHDRSSHDHGFLFWTSWKRWYDATGSSEVNEVVVEAGRTLALRFNHRGMYLPAFFSPQSTVIDIMMNVCVIYYAADQTGNRELRSIADHHCLTTRRFLVRGDGSTAHEAVFDQVTGAFLHHSTQQGWRADSTWARGQAWALHGFALAYQMSKDDRFLDTACRCADYFIDHLPPHGIPPNDLDEPDPQFQYESSAAAAAARGLLLLAELVEDPQKADRYRSWALRILETLCSDQFLAATTPGWEGILRHAIYHHRLGLGVGESVIWGDYYFVDALDTILRGSEKN
jgi:unsaturated chondroitin disaccharide hydrolase